MRSRHVDDDLRGRGGRERDEHGRDRLAVVRARRRRSRYAAKVAAATARRSSEDRRRASARVAVGDAQQQRDQLRAEHRERVLAARNDDASTTSTAYDSGIALPSSRRSTRSSPSTRPGREEQPTAMRRSRRADADRRRATDGGHQALPAADDGSGDASARRPHRQVPAVAGQQVAETGEPSADVGCVVEIGLVLVTGAVLLAPLLDRADQRLDARGVELDAGLVAELLERDLLRQRLAVRTRGGHRVVRVGDHHDVRLDRVIGVVGIEARVVAVRRAPRSGAGSRCGSASAPRPSRACAPARTPPR